MSSSPDPGHRPPREGAVLRGGAAVAARPYRDASGQVTPAGGTTATAVLTAPAAPAAPAPAIPAPAPAPSSLTPSPVMTAAAATAVIPPQPSPVERRSSVRRAEDQPVAGSRPTFRLGEVYADELERLRRQAHAEGFAAGHAEGMAAAGAAVAEAERAATERMAEAQARWERRIATATAALGSAVTRLDEAAVPVADDIRETILGTVLTLLEDLLGRELAMADSPVLDAVRRALTLCPADAPVVVRVHPDDLGEIPEEAVAELPASVRLVADASVERAGAVAETGPRRIDAQLVAALERVQAVLSS
ncbi:FliH/SctL family protein [Blastococcus sp. TF02A-30]|uniref:FliH/SctL family protein n=1 Tax=Blastococcus sp. TF02A-30 TaxID=2250580 RepID=UPI000DEB121A|nr:FliH/SctL family protein [Blastococcus sp. TF02A-30]RBY89544.1 flagellar assembly protein FliH [Blastococcus sp. TF02A-30]